MVWIIVIANASPGFLYSFRIYLGTFVQFGRRCHFGFGSFARLRRLPFFQPYRLSVLQLCSIPRRLLPDFGHRLHRRFHSETLGRTKVERPDDRFTFRSRIDLLLERRRVNLPNCIPSSQRDWRFSLTFINAILASDDNTWSSQT